MRAPGTRRRARASGNASAEPLATAWAETLTDEEIEVMERAQAVSHAIIADMFSSAVVTPGQMTVDDLRFYYWQRAADLGLKVSFSPFVSIRGRSPADREKYGKDDKVIRPGDVRLVPMSCFTCELSVTSPLPEFGGQDFRLPLEQAIAFTGDRVIFLDGRQTAFHLIE